MQNPKELVDVMYNLTVGANLTSTSFASTHLDDEHFAPTAMSFRIATNSSLQGLGILHNSTIHHDDVKMVLDFHIFDIQDFDILIGHPVEKLFVEPLTLGELDIKLGKDTYSICKENGA